MIIIIIIMIIKKNNKNKNNNRNHDHDHYFNNHNHKKSPFFTSFFRFLYVCVIFHLSIYLKAPKLITADMVAGMKPGSVTIDLAAANGGNIATTVKDEVIVTENG